MTGPKVVALRRLDITLRYVSAAGDAAVLTQDQRVSDNLLSGL